MDASISIEGIREASASIDRVFLHSPQFVCEPLSKRVGAPALLKVETVNPIRSFKGRGADYLLQKMSGARELVCASAGNFGQGMAYACRKRDVRLTVYASDKANPLKVQRMRELGAEIELHQGDFDDAKDAARRHAAKTGAVFVEDGLLGAIGEGAGTIGVELTEGDHLDAVFVPLGNGSLVNGVGTWLRRASPDTRVVAVCAASAPSMALSWKAGATVVAPAGTIADGISVRVPVRQALELMARTVDEVMLVTDDEMRAAMRLLLDDAGLLVEPSGAAGVAAIVQRAGDLEGKTVAAVLTGGNLTERQVRDWIY